MMPSLAWMDGLPARACYGGRQGVVGPIGVKHQEGHGGFERANLRPSREDARLVGPNGVA